MGASLPLSPCLYTLLQAPLVQDNTVPSHTPLLDVRPRGRNQDKPVRYCVASCINIWDEKKRSITSWDPDRRVRTPTVPFRLYVVAEDKVIGAVLTQETEGKEYIITYLYRRLIDAETRYT